jgi:hypothetical protein
MLIYSLLLINDELKGEISSQNDNTTEALHTLILDKILPNLPKTNHKRTIEAEK